MAGGESGGADRGCRGRGQAAESRSQGAVHAVPIAGAGEATRAGLDVLSGERRGRGVARWGRLPGARSVPHAGAGAVAPGKGLGSARLGARRWPARAALRGAHGLADGGALRAAGVFQSAPARDVAADRRAGRRHPAPRRGALRAVAGVHHEIARARIACLQLDRRRKRGAAEGPLPPPPPAGNYAQDDGCLFTPPAGRRRAEVACRLCRRGGNCATRRAAGSRWR